MVKTKKGVAKLTNQVVLELPAEAQRTAFSIEIFQRWYIDHNRTPISNSMFSLGEPGLPLEKHPLVEEADIIHLHSVTHFLSPNSIARLAALNKPIVWTLHDMRPFTGGCHFTAGCEKFSSNCSGCPQLGWDPYFITAAQLSDQLQAIPSKKIHPVAPTQWLAKRAQESAMFHETHIDVIPYGLDPSQFPFRWKPQAKNHLGLEPGTLHLLFVANRLGEQRKGFDHLARAIQICLQNPAFRKRVSSNQVALISLGHPDPGLAKLGIPYVCLGYLNSPEEMSQLYGAADLFLLPSIEENLPNTLLEAMSSGTPAVAFRVGGVPEVITDQENGRLVRPGSVEDFASAIEQLLFNDELRGRFGEKARAVIQEKFDHNLQAQRYLDLYLGLLRGMRTPRNKDTHGFSAGADRPIKELAPITPRLQHICGDSLPAPLQNMIFSMQRQYDADQAELRQLRDFVDGQQQTIQALQDDLDRKSGVLRKQETTILHQEEILSQNAIKMLRQLKLIKK